MAEDLYAKVAEDDGGKYWVMSRDCCSQVAVAREVNGQWFVAKDDSFAGEIGPFENLDALLDHVEQEHLFAPWAGPGM